MRLNQVILVCLIMTLLATSAASAALLDTFQTYPISSLPTNTGVVANSRGRLAVLGIGL